MAKYPKFLMEHFQNPKNVGEISDADGVGTVGNAHCGDIMQMYIKMNGNKISDAKFKTFEIWGVCHFQPTDQCK